MKPTKHILLMAAMLLCCVTRISAEIILTEADGLLATTSTNSAGTLQYEFTSEIYTSEEPCKTILFTFLEGHSMTDAVYDSNGFPFVALAEFYLYDGQGNEIALTAENFATNAQEISEGDIANICDGNRATYFHSIWSSGAAGFHYVVVTLPEGKELSDFKFKYITRYTKQCVPKKIRINFGNEVIENGSCGDNLTWSLTTDGHLDISGSGAMTDRAFQSNVLIESVSLPEGVTSIGDEAFYGCSSLTAINIPESSQLTSIGRSAFSGCSSLATITIPEGVTSIGDDAFYHCSGLTAINIPESSQLTSIGRSAFSGCSSLTAITIPKSVTSIGGYAFSYCSSLTAITIPEGVTSIGEWAFRDCSSLTAITIPEGVTSIGERAFSGCSSLTAITIPESVTSIGSSAFSDCSSLATITIPEGVTSIGSSAFNGCSLESITVDADNTVYDSRNGCNAIIKTSSNTLITGCAKTVIPASVTSIGSSAFSDCSSLTTITIPEGVTSIGSSAFSGCSSLTAITIPESVTSIGSSAFYGCSSLTAINIPEESQLTSIGYSAFYGCSSLTAITIPEGVTSIGELAFVGCSLESIIVDADNTVYDSRNGCNAIIETSSNTLITGCAKTVIPESVTSVGDYAFADCTGLTTIILPESVMSIGYGAFSRCSSLTAINIPEGVTSIGNFAFSGCTGLANIYCYAETVPSTEKYSFHQSNIGTATLHVPASALESYKTTAPWSSFGNIVTIGDMVTINQYGSGTYCSKYALDFSNVEGLKAYAATGYNKKTKVVTLTRVMTTQPGEGLFIKGEPGTYEVPVIEEADDNTLNILVGTLAKTEVNSTSDDGLYANYKYTIKEGDSQPLFYQFTDGSTFGAGKAYLQIPTAWLPATDEAKSISLRFEEGEGTTDMENSQFTIDNSQLTYDLYGRRVDNPVKGGIYIVGGRKVVY